MKYINLTALALLVSFSASAHELTEAELSDMAPPFRDGLLEQIKQSCPLADSENLSMDILKYNLCVHESLVSAIVGIILASTRFEHSLSDRIESLESQVLELMIWRGTHHD